MAAPPLRGGAPHRGFLTRSAPAITNQTVSLPMVQGTVQFVGNSARATVSAARPVGIGGFVGLRGWFDQPPQKDSDWGTGGVNKRNYFLATSARVHFDRLKIAQASSLLSLPRQEKLHTDFAGCVSFTPFTTRVPGATTSSLVLPFSFSFHTLCFSRRTVGRLKSESHSFGRTM
jgi:hypothetical protein